MNPTPDLLDSLRRHPDVEAPNLFAADAADRLILDEAAEQLAAARAGQVVVVGDHYGALTVGAARLHGARGLRVHTDRLTGERALAANAAAHDVPFTLHELDVTLLRGARLVLLQLPRSLAALDELAGAVARYASASVRLVAGGRDKHMTPSMNAVLGKHFANVQASRGRQKSRVLHAWGPTPQPDAYPERELHADLDLTVCAHGGAFAGTRVDGGTRLLLAHLGQMRPSATTAVDLGCGTGILASMIARTRPRVQVLAVDESWAAVRSARATAAANHLDFEIVRDLEISARADASVDLVLLNPPFHTGATVDEAVAHPLFSEAARVLRPQGELWTVFNSHLDHRGVLVKKVGPTRQVDRTKTFTLTVSSKQ